MKGRVLVVDDDASVALILVELLKQDGFHAESAASGEEALRLIDAAGVDVVLSDIRMPGMDGMTLLERLRTQLPNLPVVMLTAHGSVPLAVEAMRLGAADFLLKPFERDEVLFALRKSMAKVEHEAQRPPPLPQPPPRDGERLIGESALMDQLRSTLARVGPTSATVLLRGETGTGKELAAKALHAASNRTGAFVAVNCAALPENLLESELFGHLRGAFTGATATKPGRVELAEHGTLFLDEIGEMSPSLQAKLLRLLQEREYQPVGATQTRTADVRFVAATHQDLEKCVAEGTFREDLFFRLAVVPIAMPSLRERVTDIPILARAFFARGREVHGRTDWKLGDDATALLSSMSWPGNVRELQNAIERLLILADGPVVNADDVRTIVGGTGPEESQTDGKALKTRVRQAERSALMEALTSTDDNRTQTARLLGISRRTLYNKLEEHGLL